MFTKMTKNVLNISALDNRPTISAEKLKATFDQAGVDIKEAFNRLVEELGSEDAIKNIGSDNGTLEEALQKIVADNPTQNAGDIVLVDGTNTTLSAGNYWVTSLTLNGKKDDKFYNSLVRVYTADKTYISILTSNNMLQQGYNFYNVGYDGSKWSVFSVLIASKSFVEQNYYNKTEIDSKISSVYVYKGSVATKNDLPKEGMKIGDVYDIKETGMNAAWNGTEWDELGVKVDLTSYATTEYVNNIIGDYETAMTELIEGDGV